MATVTICSDFGLSAKISIITLTTSDLNASVKIQRLKWLKNLTELYFQQKTHVKHNDIGRLEIDDRKCSMETLVKTKQE